MSDRVEDKYEDILQNLEFAIVRVYEQHPELTDYEVEKAIDALDREYRADGPRAGTARDATGRPR